VTAESLAPAIRSLRSWMESRQFAGYEPFDLLNSPYLQSRWMRRFPLGVLIIQAGKKFGGVLLRRLLKVPLSRNPKALALSLSAYCDLARSGEDVSATIDWLKGELIRLRSPGEPDWCWGYDWDYLSLRGSRLTAFSPNSIATYFCGMAMLDLFDLRADPDAKEMGASAAHFLASRLRRSHESGDEVCLSYTPNDTTRIYNSSALAGVLLARVGQATGNEEYLSLARKVMTFLERGQLPNGGWYYGKLRRQRWIDSFHTSYNICALLDYQHITGDTRFAGSMLRGHRFYQKAFFTPAGAPRYFHNRTYPIDIHTCAQAMLHFAAFRNSEAALQVWDWVRRNMAAPDGHYYYQRHPLWVNRTPYMRWGQAWMLRALAKMQRAIL
jgi:hypothetical protein